MRPTQKIQKPLARPSRALRVGDEVVLADHPSVVMTIRRVGGDPNRPPYYTGPDGCYVEWERQGRTVGRWMRSAWLRIHDPAATKKIASLRRELDQLEHGA